MAKKLNWKGPTKCPECEKLVKGIGDSDSPLCPLCGCFLDNPPKAKTKATKFKD